MPNPTGFCRLEDVFSAVAPGTRLTLLVARIIEVEPLRPCETGSSQTLRIGGERGMRTVLNLYDQKRDILQLQCGSIIRITAAETAKRALRWQGKKPNGPPGGYFEARPPATIDIFREGEARLARLDAFGILCAQEEPAPRYAPKQPPAAAPISKGPTEPLATKEGDLDIEREVTQAYLRCLAAARSELGPHAAAADVHAAAKFACESLYGPLIQRKAVAVSA